RLAIQFYGNMIAYEYICYRFLKYVVDVNLNNNYSVDIFIHTWDEFNFDYGAWYDSIYNYPTLNNKKLTKNDIKKIICTYKPKLFKIESLEKNTRGSVKSFNTVRELRIKYENEKELSGTLPEKFVFSSICAFRLGIIDGRYANEGDLVFFQIMI
ncbi:hypothetical protein, partial [Campylobacter volucris]|uniref:hypothetical protein n=1 Tax=Campylobacter volucris TaxID=1031542 RepID=UPI0018A0A7D6